MSNKYKRQVLTTEGAVSIDVYDVLMAFAVKDPAIQHAIKKLLAPGQRGDKNYLQDLQEAQMSLYHAIEMEELRSHNEKYTKAEQRKQDIEKAFGHLRTE